MRILIALCQLLHFNFKLAKVVAAGVNPVQVAHGIGKTAKALVTELKKMSREVINFSSSSSQSYLSQLAKVIW